MRSWHSFSMARFWIIDLASRRIDAVLACQIKPSRQKQFSCRLVSSVDATANVSERC